MHPLSSPRKLTCRVASCLLGFLLVAGVTTTGCRSSGPKPGRPKAYHIDIKPEGTTRLSVMVYIGPANSLDGSVDTLVQRLRAQPKLDPAIRSYVVTGSEGTHRLVDAKAREDAGLWKDWLKSSRVDRLAIVADLPGVTGNAGIDPRRQILPLGKKTWPPLRDGTITVKVFPDRVETEPKPYPWSLK